MVAMVIVRFPNSLLLCTRGEPDYDGDGNVGSYCGGGDACSGDLSDFLQMVTATSSFSRVGCVSDTPPCHCRDLPLLEDKPG